MLIFIAALGVAFLAIGAKGFTRGGIPFSATTVLQGKTARIVGTICCLVGVAILAIVVWFGIKISG